MDNLIYASFVYKSAGELFNPEAAYKDFKKCLWDPEIFIHSTLNQWQERGSIPPASLANEITRRKIKQQSYRIEDGIKKELDRIYQHAMKELCG
jgi:trimethylamine:corrinoid methyltransferase-like protein